MGKHDHEPLDTPYGRALDELTRAAENWSRAGMTLQSAERALARLQQAARDFAREDAA